MTVPLFARIGMKIRAADGCEELGFPEMMSTPFFCKANPGGRLTLRDAAYKFNVATYSLDVNPEYIYTYSYSPNESWTVYRNDLSGESYRQADYVFTETVYFRICLRKVSGELFDGSEDINAILAFENAPEPPVNVKNWIAEEAEKVARRVKRGGGSLIFALLTDTHYTVNGTWYDTLSALQKVNEFINFDGIIHLGDFTDGITTGEVTRRYAEEIIGGLKSLGVPVWNVLGNHDSNYFMNNSERFSLSEQSNIYLERDEPRYYTDFENRKLRLIFTDSFDVEEELRYGYSRKCINWLDKTLKSMYNGWVAVIFSHLPPTARLQYWVGEIRGEKELADVLNANKDRVLAWINGHNHADRLDVSENGYLIASIVNAKCEAFTEYKTDGFITPKRKLGNASQEAWDVMVISPNSRQVPRKLSFIRYGAGEDRFFDGNLGT